MGALAGKRTERVCADLRIRYSRCPKSPGIDLAGDRLQSPQQLASRGGQERPGLPGTERRRIVLSERRDISRA
jgi:hypothetical protein